MHFMRGVGVVQLRHLHIEGVDRKAESLRHAARVPNGVGPAPRLECLDELLGAILGEPDVLGLKPKGPSAELLLDERLPVRSHMIGLQQLIFCEMFV